jgi:hypothetical protein
MAIRIERTNRNFLNERQRGVEMLRTAVKNSKALPNSDAFEALVSCRVLVHELGFQAVEHVGFQEADVAALETVGWVERL